MAEMGMLYEYEAWGGPDESDAHPPLEPVDVHYVVCAGCGDRLRECGCGLSVTDHQNEYEHCLDCREWLEEQNSHVNDMHR
jgi:hypothetical protein